MSRLLSIRKAIVERIAEIPALAGSVLAYRRHDIETEFEIRMEKVRGKAVVVRLLRAANQSRNKTTARFAGTYTVSLFTVPVFTEQEVDELMEAIVGKLHGWWPASIPSNGAIWCDTDTITYPDDSEYDIAVLTLQAPRTSTP